MTLGLIIPVLSIGGYLLIGSPAAAIPDVVRPTTTAGGSGGESTGQNPEQQMDELFRMAEGG